METTKISVISKIYGNFVPGIWHQFDLEIWIHIDKVDTSIITVSVF